MSTPFGVIITEATLRRMPEYQNKTITREDLAREAMRSIHDGGKNIEALNKAKELKDDYGTGITALCMIYNATGARVEIVAEKHWFGRTWKQNPPRYFDNGQWIAFLIVRPNVFRGCSGARVFRCASGSGVRDILVCYRIPLATGSINSVLTEIRSRDHFPNHWDYIFNLLKKGRKMSSEVSSDLKSQVSIGGSSTAECIAILTRPFDPLPNEY